MYYCLGTTDKCIPLLDRFPKKVMVEVIRGLAILEAEYGTDRDIFKSDGGYAIIAETEDDLTIARETFDDREHTCEWATKIGDSGYCTAMYLLSDYFAVALYIPVGIANDNILAELEQNPSC